MTPVTIISGFLGSGKTTLLARLLRTPRFGRTAVIVNEFGEVGLDHDLLEAGDDRIVELANGCLCCHARAGLAATLADLAVQRAAGRIDFDRVVIETSGLADPGPLLRLVPTHSLLRETFAVEGLATTVDATAAGATAEAYDEARRQIALADLLLVTKVDIAGRDDVAATDAAVRRLNATAPLIEARSWDGAAPTGPGLAREFGPVMPEQPDDGRARHAEAYSTVCLVREEPVPGVALLLFLEALAALAGGRMLRLKGVVNVAEADRPMVIHGVQHMIHRPEWLDAWPSGDRRTRIVLIGHGLRTRWAELLLDALVDEAVAVAAETAGGEHPGAIGGLVKAGA